MHEVFPTMKHLSLVAASAAAMVSVQAIMVFVAGGLCCLNAPSIVHKHFEISKSTGEFQKETSDDE